MANDAHVAMLKEGAQPWNVEKTEHIGTPRPEWCQPGRLQSHKGQPRQCEFGRRGSTGSNISDASLNDTDLYGADLSEVYLFRSYVLSANFEKANLRRAA